MKKNDNLYVGIAYSALEIPEYTGVMSQEWATINGHMCLGAFLLEKVEEKKPFRKPEFKGFKEYRTKQEVKGTDNQFYRSDDLPSASDCNEVFLSWFIAPVSAGEDMIDMEAYKGLPIEDIQRSLQAVNSVYAAGAKKDEIDLVQDNSKIIK